MAYCKQCGAYIPDGLSACLACGFDEAAERQGEAAEREQNEDFRLKYEEERRRRQEDNRRWAEQEKARREAEEQRREEQFRRQEEYRREAERERLRREAEAEENARKAADAEAARRKAEREVRARSFVYRTVGAGSQRSRVLSALSYLSALFLLPLFLCSDDPFARFHARQGMTLFFFSLVLDAVNAVFPLGWVFSFIRLYLIYKGMTNALNDRMEPLPVIGKLAEKKD